jgi:hypothetical protein
MKGRSACGLSVANLAKDSRQELLQKTTRLMRGTGGRTMATHSELLKPCPICGAKAFVKHDVVDGFEFGWSVGCPRFCRDDGVHGLIGIVFDLNDL